MSKSATRHKKVLVVDDDEQHLKITERLLVSAGYDVSTRNDSLNTLALVTLEAPDMVILDVKLPSIDGDRMTPLVQRCTGVHPIVLLYSGLDPALLKERASACGAADWISKGTPPAEFLERVARAFANS
jgi:DNA-binding response OmpR family regulator